MAMLAEIWRHLFKKRATVMYPYRRKEKVNIFEGVHIPEGLRGKISYDRDACIGCGLCVKFCPTGAVELTSDEKGRRVYFRLDRCCFCAQCEEVCPKKAIKLTPEFEMVAFDRSQLVVK